MTGTRRQKEMRKALRTLIPRAPMADAEPILDLALAGHLRHLPPSIALWQATTAHVRHTHTEYDALLAEGYDQDSARFFVLDAMNDLLQSWGCGRQVPTEDPDTDQVS